MTIVIETWFIVMTIVMTVDFGLHGPLTSLLALRGLQGKYGPHSPFSSTVRDRIRSVLLGSSPVGQRVARGRGGGVMQLRESNYAVKREQCLLGGGGVEERKSTEKKKERHWHNKIARAQ